MQFELIEPTCLHSKSVEICQNWYSKHLLKHQIKSDDFIMCAHLILSECVKCPRDADAKVANIESLLAIQFGIWQKLKKFDSLISFMRRANICIARFSDFVPTDLCLSFKFNSKSKLQTFRRFFFFACISDSLGFAI